MDLEEYRVNVYTPHMKYKSHPMTLFDAVVYMAEHLSKANALDCFDKGKIVPTTCVFTGDTVYHKTYVTEIFAPYTKLVLKKQTKGSFDDQELLSIIKQVKEKYERN